MNVVVVMLDSLRKDHIGAYGNPWIQTPNLDALAGESLRFTRPYPDSIPTICARRSMHTGLRTWPFRNWEPPPGEEQFPAGWQQMPDGQVPLTESLAANGYETALITDNYHQYKALINFQRGFDTFEFIRGQETDRYRSMLSVSDAAVESYTVPGNGPTLIEKARQYLANTSDRKNEEDYFAPQVFTRAMDHLDLMKRAGGEPFYLVVDSFDPHEPWDPPQKYVDLYSDGYSGREPTVPNYDVSSYLTESQLQRMKDLYAAEVSMTDAWFGKFMDKMESLGLMQNTLLFVLSDHGAALGEHGYTGKPYNALWPELTDIFFMVHHPEGRGSGKTSDFYASFQDIAPTVLANMDIAPPQPMDGQDLTPILEGKSPAVERPHFTLGYHNYSWTRDENYAMFAYNDGGIPKLYDLRQDPRMDRDIASKRPEVVKKMYEDYIVKDAGGEPPPIY